MKTQNENVNFMPNITLPEEYFNALEKIAIKKGITAEQHAKEILMVFIGKNYL